MIVTKKTSSPADVFARRGHRAGAPAARRHDPGFARGPADGGGPGAPARVCVLSAGRRSGPRGGPLAKAPATSSARLWRRWRRTRTSSLC